MGTKQQRVQFNVRVFQIVYVQNVWEKCNIGEIQQFFKILFSKRSEENYSKKCFAPLLLVVILQARTYFIALI